MKITLCGFFGERGGSVNQPDGCIEVSVQTSCADSSATRNELARRVAQVLVGKVWPADVYGYSEIDSGETISERIAKKLAGYFDSIRWEDTPWAKDMGVIEAWLELDRKRRAIADNKALVKVDISYDGSSTSYYGGKLVLAPSVAVSLSRALLSAAEGREDKITLKVRKDRAVAVKKAT